MTKRGKLEIMRDILEVIQKNKNFIKPTPLLRRSNLSSIRFKEYYSDLLERELIKEIKDKENKNITLTEKGFKFLERYKSIINFIDEFDL
ncbi:MAG: winged helix-turn-helix domain-containing protein [Flavobacterium sp.]|uniref:winged helix-turn-helix domain-containing protein n=1 Tax=Flavobacterium sp. TaxID=239 RepID=UPI002621ED98|nr:winged helix-turn-helix domain-containing protein [Flavobacterium sp.]MDD5149103.1 winged helix-turn-helix domain-containing protein [Flavobacterium sp.]